MTAASAPVRQRLLAQLAHLPGAAVRTGAAVGAGHSGDMSAALGALPAILLRPGSTAELSTMLAACYALQVPVVVQGGLTGLAGGASPLPGEVALSLERMTALARIEPLSASILVDAGVPLDRVQQAAAAEGLHFPVDIGARGSATVGGMIATNAGGIRVLRYGMMRAQVLGLEAVLADGTVLSRLGTLTKDNSGYDLKQLMIGTEGTLGVVARAVLALRTRPAMTAVALVAVRDLERAQALLLDLRGRLASRLSAFEYIARRVYAAACGFAGAAPPLAPDLGDYLLIEVEGGDADAPMFEAALAEALETGLASDVVIGMSGREQAGLWALRDACSGATFALSSTFGFDIGIPLAGLTAFVAEAEAAVRAEDPAAVLWVFGHLGDGNLHFLVTSTRIEAVSAAVYLTLARHGGALSAEHGLGREKAALLPLVRSPAEIATMRRLKAAFDPLGILNPGRVLTPLEDHR